MGAEENLEGFFEDPKTLIVYHRQQRFRKLKKKNPLSVFIRLYCFLFRFREPKRVREVSLAPKGVGVRDTGHLEDLLNSYYLCI